VEILERERINPITTMEVFSGGEGILCGVNEVQALLKEVLPPRSEVWSLREGEKFHPKEVVLRIKAPYQSYGMYETTIIGNLAQCSGWATAAHECVEGALGIPIISFGARHVHPKVAGIMDYCAVVGGCAGCSSIAGAKLCNLSPMGTMPHALIIILGSTVEAALIFDKHMPKEVPRIALVDTFKDEAEESILVASAMKGRLEGVRLDTPSERGRVTPDLVKEVRRRLDLAGFEGVKIVVSGGIGPQRIAYFIQEKAPLDIFGVGSYISDAKPIDFTADIHELAGKPIAKRGRIPGVTVSHHLERVI
jgi:nicotinate phosphoribosyltransferase